MIRKKLRSVCLALVLCLLLPAAALAADGTVYGTIEVGGIALTNSADTPVVYATTDESGTVTTEGATAENYNVMWDGSTLTLRNATIQQAKEYSDKNKEKIAVYRASGDLNLALVGENTVDALGGGSAASCGINLGNGSLTISGENSASLTVYGGPTEHGNSCGIYANGTITIDSGTVTVTGESASAASYGICAGGAVTINDGSVTATSGEAGGNSIGIYTSNSVTIKNGTVNTTGESASAASYGIDAGGAVTIEDGTVNATSGKAGGNSVGIYTLNSVTINGGDVTATAGDAVGSSYGINTANISTSITVNGGTVTATSGEAKGDSCAIFAESQINADDASSSVTINGGTVTARAGNAVGDGWYSCGIKIEGFLTITDGTVTATAADAVGTGTNKASIGIFSFKNVTISGGDVTGIGGTGEMSWGIACNDILTITGSTVVGKGGPLAGTNIQYSAGVNGMGKVELSGGTVTGTGGDTEAGDSFGICAGDTTSYNVVTVSIKNATVTATGGTATNGSSGGISATNTIADVEVTIENAAVTTTGGAAEQGSYGILAETTGTAVDVTINGNSVVRANMTGVEDVDGEPISGDSIDKQNGIIFENGEGTVYGNVELQEDLTVGADESLTIPQGATLLIPENVTLTNRGTMTNNGTIKNRGTLTIEPGGNLAGNVTGNQATYKVAGVTLNRSNLSLTAGGNAWLRAAVQPDNAANQSVTWASSDPSVATVDQNGVVTAVAPGAATITVTTVDGGFTAICTVTVRPDIPPANPNYRITLEATQGGTVTADPTAAKAGATVTLTPVPDRGYQVGSVAVTDRFGEAVAVTENADGTYTFTMPNGQVTVTVTFAEAPLPFPDVAEGDWFYDAVRYAYETGLMDGVGDNLFAPNSETTRAQLVTILYRLEGEPEVSGTSGFTDVEADTWYTDAVAWAAANGIVNGVSETEFAPGKDITREQLATILFRYAEAKGYDVSARADLSAYPDADQIQSYAAESVAWAVAEGLIQGFEDNTLRPAGNATRAQIATILMRFCEGVAK
ncbi:S-layer homology domain-containing protein [Evtepia sp.]|uniref:S-layer homology domain-containing protein n=1 Tax=Evtepia sp. TaxID=2773933 RepID=UPI003990721E